MLWCTILIDLYIINMKQCATMHNSYRSTHVAIGIWTIVIKIKYFKIYLMCVSRYNFIENWKLCCWHKCFNDFCLFCLTVNFIMLLYDNDFAYLAWRNCWNDTVLLFSICRNVFVETGGLHVWVDEMSAMGVFWWRGTCRCGSDVQKTKCTINP